MNGKKGKIYSVNKIISVIDLPFTFNWPIQNQQLTLGRRSCSVNFRVFNNFLIYSSIAVRFNGSVGIHFRNLSRKFNVSTKLWMKKKRKKGREMEKERDRERMKNNISIDHKKSISTNFFGVSFTNKKNDEMFEHWIITYRLKPNLVGGISLNINYQNLKQSYSLLIIIIVRRGRGGGQNWPVFIAWSIKYLVANCLVLNVEVVFPFVFSLHVIE